MFARKDVPRETIVHLIFSRPQTFLIPDSPRVGRMSDIYAYDLPEFPRAGTFLMFHGMYSSFGDSYYTLELNAEDPLELARCAGA